MKSYPCGCKSGENSFQFCATHALDPRRDEINRFWWSKYTPGQWANYKKDLEIGLGLDVSENTISPTLRCAICGKNWNTCDHLDIEMTSDTR